MALQRLSDAAAAARWLSARARGSLVADSRQARAGDAFLAWPGAAHDARRFVPQALGAGAAACLVEADGAEAFGFDDPRIGSLAGLKAGAGVVAAGFFGEPSRELQVIAVTGTNGKTSTAWWLAQAFAAVGRRCAVVGTLGIGEPPALEPSGLTTPDPVALQAAFRRLADAGFAACAIEASSIGIVEHRLAGTRVAAAVFTNFTQDHLDYHGTMQAYWAAKRRLFDWPGLRAAVVNIDDQRGAELAAELRSAALDLWTVSLRGPARLRARGLRHEGPGLAFDLAEGPAVAGVRSSAIGEYNASNLLGVIGALRALGVGLAEACAAIERLSSVPGRMQQVGRTAAPMVVVDYAHTPDALEKALHALREPARSRGGALWCVFGCGGDRDPGKRPLMGAVAERHADRAVLTSDNPRRESPPQILAQVLAGMAGTPAVYEDRAQAIAFAVREAAAADVVLIAGKGHEDYQDIGGVKRPFSDAEHAERALRQRQEAAC
jgi:UDP-N-acetylmuramoyl-L-alanyl-D-glutamate--2,6-diaminopimelate ligase